MLDHRTQLLLAFQKEYFTDDSGGVFQRVSRGLYRRLTGRVKREAAATGEVRRIPFGQRFVRERQGWVRASKIVFEAPCPQCGAAVGARCLGAGGFTTVEYHYRRSPKWQER